MLQHAGMRNCFAIAAILFGAAGSAAADELDDDLAALQGTWVLQRSVQPGSKALVQKHVVGRGETTSIFDAEGKLQHAQTSEFRLERVGKLRLLHWTGAVVTYGPRQGQKIADGTAVYRIVDNIWTEVVGLEEGASFSPHAETWHKKPAADAPPSPNCKP